jgi:hypothetical protein
MHRLLPEAFGRRTRRLHAEVSVTARLFFSATCFKHLRHQKRWYRGVSFHNTLMEKIVR